MSVFELRYNVLGFVRDLQASILSGGGAGGSLSLAIVYRMTNYLFRLGCFFRSVTERASF